MFPGMEFHEKVHSCIAAALLASLPSRRCQRPGGAGRRKPRCGASPIRHDIYLFGTIHLLLRDKWRSAAFDKAAAGADTLVIEN